MSERLSLDLSGKRIHLSVVGGCGGTTLGLQSAVDEIQSEGRVLWASPEMPNATRFSQLFSSLSIVESSRFHAMNLIGAMDRCVDAIVQAAQSLPRVGLIVLDDWCSPTGRIEKDHLDAVFDLAERIHPKTCIFLISKSGTDVSGTDSTYKIRSETQFKNQGFATWALYEGQKGATYLDMEGDVQGLKIDESGFVLI